MIRRSPLGPQCDKKCFNMYAKVASPVQWYQRQYGSWTKSNQDLPGQPGGGLPGEGYLKCVQSLETI